MDQERKEAGEQKFQSNMALPNPYSIYNSKSELQDRDLISDSNESMDTMMVFAGLFSAVIATLVVDTLTLLQPDEQKRSNDLLATLIQVTKNTSISTPNAALPGMDTFSAPRSAIVLNILFFVSLLLSLLAALGAMLVKQWTRFYSIQPSRESIAWRRARRRHKLYQGVQDWHLLDMISWLPMLMHAALFLFLVGVVLWLQLIDQILFITMTALFSAAVVLYLALAIVPAFSPHAPFYWPPASFGKWCRKHIRSLIKSRTRRSRPSTQDSTIEGNSKSKNSEATYIATPEFDSQKRPQDQMFPPIYTPVDAALLVDVLRHTDVHAELEAAIEHLYTARWDGGTIKSVLIPDGDVILQRIGELAGSCLRGRRPKISEGLECRARRVCRFVEWFYYLLTPIERRSLKAWPADTIAKALANSSVNSSTSTDELRTAFFIADMILAASVTSKLKHVKLADGEYCGQCIGETDAGHRARRSITTWVTNLPEPAKWPYPLIRKGQALTSAYIWLEVDCILHYALPQSPQNFDWNQFFGPMIIRTESIILSFHYFFHYEDLVAILGRILQSLDKSDDRSIWFKHTLDYIHEYEVNLRNMPVSNQ